MYEYVIRCGYSYLWNGNDDNYRISRNTMIEIKTAFTSCAPLPVGLIISSQSKSEEVKEDKEGQF